MSPLAWFVCVLVGSIGYGAGVRRRAWHGRSCYAAALVNHGVDADAARAEAEWWYRPGDDELEVETFGEVSDDEYAADLRAVPGAARRVLGPDGGGEGAPGVLAGGGRAAIGEVMPADSGWSAPRSLEQGPLENVPRPGDALTGNPAGPGHRGYGPYLAAIGRDDPAGWYANLTAGDPPPEPGPAPEAAWLERQLYEGAVWSARLETWGSRFTDAFHSDVAAWDRMAARWCDEARWQLVGARSWPHPDLEPAT